MIGLAMRAGKVIIGTEQVCLALPKKGRVLLVLVSDGASDATKKKLFVKCEFYSTRAIRIPLDTQTLGRTVGKTYSPACVAITDASFAEAIGRIILSDEN